MKGAEFHRNNFSGNHVVEGGECYLVQGVSSCYCQRRAEAVQETNNRCNAVAHVF